MLGSPVELNIKSTCSDRELVLSNRNGDHFEARISGDIEVSVSVYEHTSFYGLDTLFQKLGSQTKPWEGELSWESIEGEFKITANCSSLGHVQFDVSFWGHIGSPGEWRLNVGLENELGQLPVLAKKSAMFFS